MVKLRSLVLGDLRKHGRMCPLLFHSFPDKTVCDHPLPGKCCEAPDQVGPPLSYMKERGIFKPAEFLDNPMGLCQFSNTSPEKSNVLTGLKLADYARKIYRMVEIARSMGYQFTIVIFYGESISPTCLLGQLHSRASVSRMVIHTDREANMGRRNYVYCCPICTYIVKNATALLDHIVVGHYWGSFSCGMCLSFAAKTTEEMKRHVGTCVQSQTGCRRARSARRGKRRGKMSGHKSKKAAKRTNEGVGTATWQKPRDSPTSQEQTKK